MNAKYSKRIVFIETNIDNKMIQITSLTRLSNDPPKKRLKLFGIY